MLLLILHPHRPKRPPRTLPQPPELAETRAVTIMIDATNLKRHDAPYLDLGHAAPVFLSATRYTVVENG